MVLAVLVLHGFRGLPGVRAGLLVLESPVGLVLLEGLVDQSLLEFPVALALPEFPVLPGDPARLLGLMAQWGLENLGHLYHPEVPAGQALLEIPENQQAPVVQQVPALHEIPAGLVVPGVQQVLPVPEVLPVLWRRQVLVVPAVPVVLHHHVVPEDPGGRCLLWAQPVLSVQKARPGLSLLYLRHRQDLHEDPVVRLVLVGPEGLLDLTLLLDLAHPVVLAGLVALVVLEDLQGQLVPEDLVNRSGLAVPEVLAAQPHLEGPVVPGVLPLLVDLSHTMVKS